MSLRRISLLIALLALLTVALLPSTAQDGTPAEVTVPDVSGLNLAQAAAVLNRAGLRLGATGTDLIGPTLAAEPDTVTVQFPSIGDTVPYGTDISVRVARAPNALLIYDDNDLTLVNRAGQRIELGNLRFTTVQAIAPAAFDAGRWGQRVPAGDCVQVWSVGRSSPKSLAECASISTWLTTNRRDEHFWTAGNGVTTFNVIQGNQERAICQAATAAAANAPLTCEFYASVAGQGAETPFIMFAYTENAFFVINRSTTDWMPLNTTTIYNRNPNAGVLGAQFVLGTPETFGSPQAVADLWRLAPGQCAGFHAEGSPADPPEACSVTAVRTLSAAERFWALDFELSGLDGERRTCAAATPGKLTLCIMPR
jgi:hypothetical protein